MGRMFLDGHIKKVIIVAPCSVVPAWPKEMEKHADFLYEMHTLEGNVQKRCDTVSRLSEPVDQLQMIVTNYEAIAKMEQTIAKWKPDMIVCDESIKIKTPGATQSKALHRLGKVAKYKIILNGTPITNSPLDLFSQYKFLDSGLFGTSFTAFKSRYAIMGGYQNYQVVGFRNLDELIKKAHSIAYQVSKKDCLDLPDEVDHYRYCDFEPSAKKLYKQMKEDAVAELENGDTITAVNVVSKLLRLSQVCGGYLGGENVSCAKLDLLKEILETVEGKAVIFCRFLDEIKAVEGILQGNFVTLKGDVPMEDRGALVDKFQNDPNTKYFVAQIATAGLGITLTAASTSIFYSYDYNYANYSQAKARLHRIGQKHTVNHIHLVVQKTIDEKVIKSLSEKKNLADLVTLGWKEMFK